MPDWLYWIFVYLHTGELNNLPVPLTGATEQVSIGLGYIYKKRNECKATFFDKWAAT